MLVFIRFAWSLNFIQLVCHFLLSFRCTCFLIVHPACILAYVVAHHQLTGDAGRSLESGESLLPFTAYCSLPVKGRHSRKFKLTPHAFFS